jgi:hypothetical protein
VRLHSLAAHDALPRGLQRGLVVVRHIHRGRQRRPPLVDADGIHRAENASYHVRQLPLLRQLAFAFRVCLPERRSEGFLPPKLHVPLHAGVLVQPLQRKVPARGGASVGHHPASVAPSVFEHLVEQVMTFPEAYSPLIVL